MAKAATKVVKSETEKQVVKDTVSKVVLPSATGIEVEKEKAEEKKPVAIDKELSYAQTNTYDENFHLSEEEFDSKYKRAALSDYKPGISVFTKERFGEKFIAKQQQPLAPVLEHSTFSGLVYHGTGYVLK